jgi:hypothetical protein
MFTVPEFSLLLDYISSDNTLTCCRFRVDITSENRLKKFRDGGVDTISGDVLKKKLETQ